MSKRLYGIRGAVCAENTCLSIQKETVEMIEKIIKENNLISDDIVSLQFTLTKDLDEKNPAAALRLGIKDFDFSSVALFCSQEAFIKGGMEKVIRVLVTCYMEEGKKPFHVYLNGAEKLRPDFSNQIRK